MTNIETDNKNRLFCAALCLGAILVGTSFGPTLIPRMFGPKEKEPTPEVEQNVETNSDINQLSLPDKNL